MPRAKKTCSTAGCPELVDKGTGRCSTCTTQAEVRRGTARQRGYGRGHQVFRRQVLARDPICVLCRKAWATHADHYPLGRDELVEQGLNPNDPQHGRGLCAPCDSTQTTTRQPGGWHGGHG